MQIAARHIRQAFKSGAFGHDFVQAYDRELYSKLDRTRRKLLMQRVFNRPWLIESLVALGTEFLVERPVAMQVGCINIFSLILGLSPGSAANLNCNFVSHGWK